MNTSRLVIRRMSEIHARESQDCICGGSRAVPDPFAEDGYAPCLDCNPDGIVPPAERDPLDVWNRLACAAILAGPAWFIVLLAIHYLRH